MKEDKKIICPFCNSDNVAEYLYGLPVFSEELNKEIKEGKIILGGCEIDDQFPLYKCNNCGKEWSDS